MRAGRARPSRSGSRPSARSIAGRRAATSRRAIRGARSRRRGCRAACRASSRSNRSTRLLAVVEDGPRRAAPGDDPERAALRARARAARPGAGRDRLRGGPADQRAGRRADLGSLDLRRGEIRVLGKGRKERIGLLGRPGPAGAGGLPRGRPAGPARAPARRREAPPAEIFLNHLGGPLGVRGLRYRLDRLCARAGLPGRRLAAHAAPLVRDAPARRRRRPAGRPGAARPREPGDDPDLHPRLARSPPGRLSGGPSAGPARPDPVTAGRRARPRRDDRLGRVPRLARARLRPGRRHRATPFRPAELDAFFAAFRLPDLIFQLVAAGALSSALIPIVSALLSRPTSEPRAWRVVSTVINLMLIGLAVLAVALFILAPVVVPIITPGLRTGPSSTRPSS